MSVRQETLGLIVNDGFRPPSSVEIPVSPIPLNYSKEILSTGIFFRVNNEMFSSSVLSNLQKERVPVTKDHYIYKYKPIERGDYIFRLSKPFKNNPMRQFEVENKINPGFFEIYTITPNHIEYELKMKNGEMQSRIEHAYNALDVVKKFQQKIDIFENHSMQLGLVPIVA